MANDDLRKWYHFVLSRIVGGIPLMRTVKINIIFIKHASAQVLAHVIFLTPFMFPPVPLLSQAENVVDSRPLVQVYVWTNGA